MSGGVPVIGDRLRRPGDGDLLVSREIVTHTAVDHRPVEFEGHLSLEEAGMEKSLIVHTDCIVRSPSWKIVKLCTTCRSLAISAATSGSGRRSGFPWRPPPGFTRPSRKTINTTCSLKLEKSAIYAYILQKITLEPTNDHPRLWREGQPYS